VSDKHKRNEAWHKLQAAIGPGGITSSEAQPICGDMNSTSVCCRLAMHTRAGRLFSARPTRRVPMRWFLTAADRDAWVAEHYAGIGSVGPAPIVTERAPWGDGPMPAGYFSEPVRRWFGAYFRSDLLDPEGPHTVLQHNLAMSLSKQAREAREAGKGWAAQGEAVQSLERRA
jgi:hypothetical protein